MIRKLTKADVPDGSKIAVFHDIHIPIHDERAMQLAVECCEAVGVTHTMLMGDIADCGIASRHDGKRRKDTINWGKLQESVEPGRWIYDWARTRPCRLFRGNHERWVENMIESDATLSAVSPEALMGLPEDGDGWEVLDSKSRVRIGSLVLEHGHGMFPSGNGGQNPGQRIKTIAPNQTTLIGHLHREFATYWTVRNEEGIPKLHAAFGGGHMSVEELHEDYAGGYPGWQQSFEIIRVWWDGDRPRFTLDVISVHRDKRNRPCFEYAGRVYR